MKIKNIAFVGIPVTDMKRAREFYESPCCHMAVVQDPDGNKLIIHKLKPENEKEPCP